MRTLKSTAPEEEAEVDDDNVRTWTWTGPWTWMGAWTWEAGLSWTVVGWTDNLTLAQLAEMTAHSMRKVA